MTRVTWHLIWFCQEIVSYLTARHELHIISQLKYAYKCVLIGILNIIGGINLIWHNLWQSRHLLTGSPWYNFKIPILTAILYGECSRMNSRYSYRCTIYEGVHANIYEGANAITKEHHYSHESRHRDTNTVTLSSSWSDQWVNNTLQIIADINNTCYGSLCHSIKSNFVIIWTRALI